MVIRRADNCANGALSSKTGHLTKITDNLNNNKNREYEFDAVGRLKKMKGGPTGNLSTQTYAYDRFGNRTSVTATGVAADNSPMPVDGIPNLPLTFNTANNRITTDGFQYDSAGNQTRALGEDGIWLKYEYDAANRLRVVKHDDGSPNGVGMQAFMYGSSNARLIDYDYGVGMNKLFASVGGTTLSEYTEFAGAIPTWTKSYTYLGDSQLSTITPNGVGGEAFEYNHPDRLGTKLTTNPQTGAVSEQTTLPFGKTLTAESGIVGQTGTTSGTGASTKKFTSYDRSAATGLDYAVNRTYDSKQGRFTQVDPIGMRSVSLVNPQTLNLYAYCANDPINHADPSGLGFFSFLKKLFKWIMVAIAVIVAVAAIATFNLPAGIGILKALTAILGLVAAITGAASSVLGALGYTRAAKIFGIIAAITGMGSLILAKTGIGQFSESGPINWGKLGAQQGLFTGVGAITNSFAGNGKSRKGFPCAPNFNQILARFGNFLFDLLGKESGHLTNSPLENGGWVYQRKNGDLFFLRAEKFGGAWRRTSGTINLGNPPNIKGARVVAKAHTHPYTPYDQGLINGGGYGGPSGYDINNSINEQMPSLVAHQIGVENNRPLFQIESAANVWRINDKNCKDR